MGFRICTLRIQSPMLQLVPEAFWSYGGILLKCLENDSPSECFPVPRAAFDMWRVAELDEEEIARTEDV